jgi:hypothetical protein
MDFQSTTTWLGFARYEINQDAEADLREVIGMRMLVRKHIG